MANSDNSTACAAQGQGLMKKALAISRRGKVTGEGLLAYITKSHLDAKPAPKAIVERNGIFMIKDDLETSSVEQDPALKALIDAVIG